MRSISSTWENLPLSTLTDIRFSNVDKKTEQNEIDVRLCNYTDVYYNNFIRPDMQFMEATATKREIEKCALCKDDVVITKDSEKHDDIGVPALVKENIKGLVCGYHLAIIRPLKQIYGPYLFYALSSPAVQRQFHAYANGVTRFGLRKADVGIVGLPVPPYTEQRTIAHVLGTLEEKIGLNQRMNETLEKMARALFKSWFVDFDPVQAKMEGRDTGLPKEIADLFPDRLVESEQGDVPEGWSIRNLAETFNLEMGQSPPGNTYNKHAEGLPFFQGSSDFGFRFPLNRKFCTDPKRIAQPGDTLVSVRAPVGDINMAQEECCIGRGVAALRHRSNSTSFTYYYAWMIQKQLRQYEHTGTVFGSINKKQFEALPVLEPTKKLVKAFDAQVNALDTRVQSCTSETRLLASLREELLPKLVSGEIQVNDITHSRAKG